MRKLKYSDKVKKASTVVNAINGLKVDQSINILYDSNTYNVKAYRGYNGKLDYSIWNRMRGMNISSIGRTSISLYSFDMMTTKTTYRMSLVNATLLPDSVDAAA